ncbi:chemotaxis protein histidine kinase and related kinases [Coriobacteriaceae bacterium EMTCatB1]|nr:chemotaxis protein histidine kinase and related kinases [Coriobacteriaceae bacterium EMTCatB1]
MVEFDRSAFIQKFQEEATEYLQRLNEGVITLEGDPKNRELIDQMLRDAHTLKGSSRMVGLLDISDIAHRLEDIMVKIRDGEMQFDPSMSDSFFEALDAIVFLKDNAGKDVSEQIDVPSLLDRLAAVASGSPSEVSQVPPSAEPQPAPSAAAAPAPHESQARQTSEPEPAAAAPGPQQAPAQPAVEEKLQTRTQQTVRIRTEQVDRLLNLVSEVVISQIKAEQHARDLRVAQALANDLYQAWRRVNASLAFDVQHVGAASDDLGVIDEMVTELKNRMTHMLKEYSDEVSRASTVVADLQEHSMAIRMLPVSTVFNAFPRAVRDLARQFKKEVDLVIEGGDTELDKKVLEEINDPLIHIMRNAVDHGIEPVEKRRELGKPEKGTIRLAARQEGDHIVIEISDDGAGIDPAAVKAAAVRKGYITESEAKSMSDREATYLIFEAGFSTSPIITEISGRGVGMDVVREFIVDKLKGSLDVESRPGEGTTFRLTIPLTLAIIRALLVRVSGQVFAIPTASIEETLRIDPAEVIKAEGREVIRRQRRTIPLVHLRDVLGLPADEEAETRKLPVVTIGFSGHRMGFLVDAFVGEQQIVIKTLGSHLKHVDNVAGVTILGAGEVVPILNVPDLMANARRMTGKTAGTRVKPAEERGPRRVLICEDSFTTRELERSIFEAAGYVVETATDGAAGLTKLRGGLQVDAVVTDVQMPNMTGFELTRAIKSDDALKDIPVIIVTSLEREEEKAEGIDAGADAYITKSVFNQDTLLDTVERLIR